MTTRRSESSLRCCRLCLRRLSRSYHFRLAGLRELRSLLLPDRSTPRVFWHILLKATHSLERRTYADRRYSAANRNKPTSSLRCACAFPLGSKVRTPTQAMFRGYSTFQGRPCPDHWVAIHRLASP